MRALMVVMVGIVVAAGSVLADTNEARVIGDRELQNEMQLNDKVARYIERNGYPDVAEMRFLSDEAPWDEHQVTLYYLDSRRAMSFARAWILGQPSIHLEKSEQPLSEEQVAQLAPLARSYGPPTASGGAAARAQAAADRAEAAAARVDAAAAATERAADRAEAVLAKLSMRRR